MADNRVVTEVYSRLLQLFCLPSLKQNHEYSLLGFFPIMFP